MIRKRIIIGGLPRAGTSLLRTLMDSSPTIISLAETGFFLRTQEQRQANVERSCARVNKVLQLEPERVAQQIISIDDQLRCFDRFIELYMEKHGIRKTVWAEKSPRNCEHYERLLGLDPDLLFISVIRDGREVVTSKIPGRSDYHCTVDRFCSTVEDVLKFEHERHLVVRYEDLTGAPEDTLSRLFDFIGEPYDANLLQQYMAPSVTRDPSLMNQPKVGKPIEAPKPKRWLGSEHRERIEEFLSHPRAMELNAMLGYGTQAEVDALSDAARKMLLDRGLPQADRARA